MVLLLAFSINKKPTSEIPQWKITERDYDEVFDHWRQYGVTYLYRMVHKRNDNKQPHLHFHGLLYTTQFMDLKKLKLKGYSFEFKTSNIDEGFHDYCHHEDNDKVKELNERDILAKFNHATNSRKARQATIPTLLKVCIHL